MKLTRVSIELTKDEREGLRILAEQHLRDPRLHVRFMIQRELARRGILPHDADPHKANRTVPSLAAGDSAIVATNPS